MLSLNLQLSSIKPEPKFLTLTAMTKMVEKFPFTEAGATAAVEYLEKEGGGTIYRIDYHTDKHGDNMPRSTKVGTVNG